MRGLCPAGYYCPDGTAIPCPVGTYRPVEGGVYLSDCWACAAWQPCMTPGLSAPEGNTATTAQPALSCWVGTCLNAVGGACDVCLPGFEREAGVGCLPCPPVCPHSLLSLSPQLAFIARRRANCWCRGLMLRRTGASAARAPAPPTRLPPVSNSLSQSSLICDTIAKTLRHLLQHHDKLRKQAPPPARAAPLSCRKAEMPVRVMGLASCSWRASAPPAPPAATLASTRMSVCPAPPAPLLPATAPPHATCAPPRRPPTPTGASASRYALKWVRTTPTRGASSAHSSARRAHFRFAKVRSKAT